MDREGAFKISLKTTTTEGPCFPENTKEVQQVQQEHSPYERDKKVASVQQWQMQKLVCLKAKKPQIKVTSAQQWQVQK